MNSSKYILYSNISFIIALTNPKLFPSLFTSSTWHNFILLQAALQVLQIPISQEDDTELKLYSMA